MKTNINWFREEAVLLAGGEKNQRQTEKQGQTERESESLHLHSNGGSDRDWLHDQNTVLLTAVARLQRRLQPGVVRPR